MPGVRNDGDRLQTDQIRLIELQEYTLPAQVARLECVVDVLRSQRFIDDYFQSRGPRQPRIGWQHRPRAANGQWYQRQFLAHRDDKRAVLKPP